MTGCPRPVSGRISVSVLSSRYGLILCRGGCERQPFRGAPGDSALLLRVCLILPRWGALGGYTFRVMANSETYIEWNLIEAKCRRCSLPYLYHPNDKGRRKGMCWECRVPPKFIRERRAMLAAQGNRCAICGKDGSECAWGLVLDHSHTTGKPRGMLCPSCNSMLGFACDNLATLRAAIRYLTNIGL